MIVVSLQGGLGNQLFQYATGRALSASWDKDLVLDLDWFDAVVGKEGVTVREYALAPFQLPVRTQSVGRRGARGGRLSRMLLGLAAPFVPRSQGQVRLVKEASFRYSPGVFGAPGAVWLDGYWQSWRYFSSIESELRAELATPRQMSGASQAMLERIRRCAMPVCVHVRRGDYVTNAGAADFHGTCGVDYYQDALAALARTGDPTCFIFSDDADWVRANLHLPSETVVVDVNGPDDAHQDLWLMASCRHFVIANSSLSWWGAWLGSSPDKQVFAPKRWFRQDQRDTSDLIPPDWQRL